MCGRRRSANSRSCRRSGRPASAATAAAGSSTPRPGVFPRTKSRAVLKPSAWTASHKFSKLVSANPLSVARPCLTSRINEINAAAKIPPPNIRTTSIPQHTLRLVADPPARLCTAARPIETDAHPGFLLIHEISPLQSTTCAWEVAMRATRFGCHAADFLHHSAALARAPPSGQKAQLAGLGPQLCPIPRRTRGGK